MLKQTEGSHAVAEAVALCRPQVICAYPITPQTHIVEGLGEMVKSGELTACEFINVESEFAAMSVAIGSSAAGVRTYTATSSQGHRDDCRGRDCDERLSIDGHLFSFFCYAPWAAATSGSSVLSEIWVGVCQR